MFKYQSCEKDLLSNMTKNLVRKDNKSDKLAKAIELISSASEVFEASGMTKEADKLISILEKIATHAIGMPTEETYGLSDEDYVNMYSGDVDAQLKVNQMLKKHLSPDEIEVRLGDKYLEPLAYRRLLREQMSRIIEKAKTPKEIEFNSKLLEENHDKNERRESLHREISDLITKSPSEGGEASKLAKTNNKIKNSIQQLIKNMERTGTPFAFDGNDLDELDTLEIDDQDMSDINNINIEMSETDFEDED